MDKLQIHDAQIVDRDQHPVYLRGPNVGGWLNMEHFINGYSGSESRLRALMQQTLGDGKATFFFERLLEHLFNEDDVRFLKARGVTAIRLPVNYRHLESDMAPFEYLEHGFDWLDRALDWCEKHGLYVILDLHSVQGWQNGDWHCDNSTRHTLFWTHKQFQERYYALWQEIARRYRSRGVVAAYDLVNEPLSNAPFGRFIPDEAYRGDWATMNRIYRQSIECIRSIDAATIIILEGDYYSTLFDGLEPPSDPNTMYSSHNYLGIATSAIPAYPLNVDGIFWNAQRIQQQFVETQGYRCSRQHGVPLLVGEFGFNVQHIEAGACPQIQAFADQLRSYNQCGVHWMFWTYKDVGAMGWLQLDPESAYLHTIRPFLRAKAALRPDFGWLSGFPPEVDKPISEISTLIHHFIPDLNPATNKRYFAQAAMSTYTADQLQALYVQQFVQKSETEIDDMLKSFRLENCLRNADLDGLLSAHSKAVIPD